MSGFYSTPEWIAVRDAAKKRDGNRCTRCGTPASRSVRILVHHIVPLKHAPNLALDIQNLVCLCDACHNKAHGDDASRLPPRMRAAAEYRDRVLAAAAALLNPREGAGG